MTKTKIIKIYGRVQNIGFRYAAALKAKEHGITGFVKNLPDKTVYIEAQGDEISLEHFLLWCKKGPDWASVTKVIITETETNKYKLFERK